jgi:hypothetical protein
MNGPKGQKGGPKRAKTGPKGQKGYCFVLFWGSLLGLSFGALFWGSLLGLLDPRKRGGHEWGKFVSTNFCAGKKEGDNC